MKVHIRYPREVDIFRDVGGAGTVETLEAADLGGGRAELREHASFIPLAPGDVVAYDVTQTVTDVVSMAPAYVFEVQMLLPNDRADDARAAGIVAGVFEEWRRDAWVTQTTNFTALVSTQSRKWFDDTVRPNRYVHFVDERRTPELHLDLEVAVQHPDLDGHGGGPWA